MLLECLIPRTTLNGCDTFIRFERSSLQGPLGSVQSQILVLAAWTDRRMPRESVVEQEIPRDGHRVRSQSDLDQI